MLKAGDGALDQRALLLSPLSLSVSSLDHHEHQIMEKEGLENYIRGFMAMPGCGLHLFPHSTGQNTDHGANLTASKAGGGHLLVGPGKKEMIWWSDCFIIP